MFCPLFFWNVMQCRMAAVFQSGTANWSSLEGSSRPRRKRLLTSFHPALPNIPEELRPRLLCSGSLKSCSVHYIYWIMAITYYSFHGYTYTKCALLSVLFTFHACLNFINGQESANKIYLLHQGMLTNNDGILES